MNIVILGGGIAGLLGAYALRAHKPTIIESSGRLGGNFAHGGLKYIHDTPDVRKLLNDLGVAFEPYRPRGAIHIYGRECSYPETVAEMSSSMRYQVQLAHWSKTRATSRGFREDCMNDPMGNHDALRCNHRLLLERLEMVVRDYGCDVRGGSVVTAITALDVHLNEGMSQVSIGYDMLVPTLSLGVLAKLAPWAQLPKAEATKLAVFDVELPIRIRPSWDYIYTPMLNWISRVAQPEPHSLTVEVPWYLPQSDALIAKKPEPTTMDVIPDVMSILKDSMGLEGTCIGSRLIPGHLRPLDDVPRWPTAWQPLGRFAQWDSRATADKVYARALSIASSVQA